MGRPRITEARAHIGMMIERPLWEKLSILCRATGVSMAFAIRRGIIEMVNNGRIPINDIKGPDLDDFGGDDIEEPEDTEDPVAALRAEMVALQGKLQALQGARPPSEDEIAGPAPKPGQTRPASTLRRLSKPAV